jgi:hypothetical protein
MFSPFGKANERRIGAEALVRVGNLITCHDTILIPETAALQLIADQG